jgi:hypothetical protein
VIEARGIAGDQFAARCGHGSSLGATGHFAPWENHPIEDQILDELWMSWSPPLVFAPSGWPNSNRKPMS